MGSCSTFPASAHLFGGEARLVEDAQTRLAAQGITSSAGVADNPRAAWALARFSAQKIAPEDLGEKAFARLFHDLPLAALGLDENTVADMARAGLRRIGDVALRPRAPITARFGTPPIARLDELRGLARPSIAPRFPPPDFSAERRFASPIATVEAIELSLRKLADDLVVLLERQAKGARRVELSLHRVDGAVRRIAVGASRPLNEARALVRLFAEKLASPDEDAIDAGFGVDLMRLSCLTAEPLAPSQSQIERAHEAERARALADLIDRLSARLGARAVTRRELIEAHLPELAEGASPVTWGEARRGGEGGRLCERPSGRARGEAIHAGAAPFDHGLLPSGSQPGGRNDDTNAAPSRPLRLFVRPEPIEAVAEVPDGPPLRFRWRRVLHDVAAIEGPERIAPPWWRRDGGPTRDYFRAEDSQGRRFWLFREGLSAARRSGRNGSCTGCSGNPLASALALRAGERRRVNRVLRTATLGRRGKKETQPVTTILIILLVVILLGGGGGYYGYRGYGGPGLGGALGLVIVVLVVLWLLGVLGGVHTVAIAPLWRRRDRLDRSPSGRERRRVGRGRLRCSDHGSGCASECRSAS